MAPTGSLSLTSDIVLPDVLIVHSFQFNLISVSQLLSQIQYVSALFTNFSCTLHGHSLKKSLVISKTEKKIYLLHAEASTTADSCCDSLPPYDNSTVHNSHPCDNDIVNSFHSCKNTFCNGSSLHSVHSNKTDVFWHQWMGHMPYHRILSISFLKDKIPSKQPFVCSIYPMVRQQRLYFSNSTIKSIAPFQLIHVDLWEPYYVQTYNGFKNFLTIVDNYSRVTWTHLLSCKSNSFPSLRILLSWLKSFSFLC